jgi:hypothetical protein
MNKNYRKLLFLLFIFFALVHCHERCYREDDTKESKPVLRKLSSFEKKWLQTQKRTLAPIRIVIDTNSLKAKGRERDLIINTISKKIIKNNSLKYQCNTFKY